MRIAILLGTLALASCGQAERATASKPRATLPAGPKLTVVAPDLYEIDGERVRLANASTPQPTPAAKCWAEAALAVKAADFVIEATGGGYKGSTIAADQIKRVGKDADGITRVTIDLGAGGPDDDGDLGGKLIEAGLAATWSPQGWDWCGAKPDPMDHNGPVLGFENGLNRYLAQREASRAARP